MAHFRRFGRRIPAPSTLAISRDLRALLADEKARGQSAASDSIAPKSLDVAAADAIPNALN